MMSLLRRLLDLVLPDKTDPQTAAWLKMADDKMTRKDARTMARRQR